VWLHEYLADFEDKQDVLRYVLTANAPEAKDNDFTWRDFQSRNNNELVAILGNFVNRAVVLTHKYYDGEVPLLGETEPFDVETMEAIPAIVDRVELNLDQFKFREAIREAMNLARLGNKYLADTEPWKLQKTNPERVKTIMNISLQITANLALVMEPFLPFTAKKMRDMLAMEEASWEDCGKTGLLKSSHKIDEAKLLFEKIEDTKIQEQLDKLARTKTSNEAENRKTIPAKTDISFDDFTKMDIRIGTILEAEKVPKTKKLIKLKVDTGIDTRTVVSGIADFFGAETIVGKQVCILVNLAPRKIKGIESQGMILMAEDADGRLEFVAPRSKIKPGSEVR
jgi:methionyl-tRNA synthetase